MREMGPGKLREHIIRLSEGAVTRRPLTESDWSMLMLWAADPQVLHFSEGDDVTTRSLEETQAIFRHVSQDAFCFLIERNGEPVGDCWLQRLNLERLKERFPGRDSRRIDLELAAHVWGQGIGGAAVRALTRFAFDTERADIVFACDIGDHNPRSRRMFECEGFR